MGKLHYTIDVTVQSDHGTPAPTYRYTGEFWTSVDEDDARALRQHALALATTKAHLERHIAEDRGEPVNTNTQETTDDALRRTAKELIHTREALARETTARDDAEQRARDAGRHATLAERRCVRLAHCLDVRDGHARDLVGALTTGPPGLPWWVQATRSLDALDALANSEQLEPVSEGRETLDETLDRVGDDVTRALADHA